MRSTQLTYFVAITALVTVSYPVLVHAEQSAASTSTTSTTSIGVDPSAPVFNSSPTSRPIIDNMSSTASASTLDSAPSGSLNWDTENDFWRNNYTSRPYYNRARDYSTYEPAYRYGVDTYARNSGKRFEDIDQTRLSQEWERSRGNSNLTWSDAQPAVRDSYNRMLQNSNTGTPDMLAPAR